MFRENQAHFQENLFALQRRLPKKVLQRLEKTIQISSKMRKMSRAELMVQAMGKVIRKMSPSEQEALAEVYAPLTTDEGIRKYLRNLSSTQEKLEGIAQMMKDLLDLLQEAPISETPAYALLKRIFEDQTICVEEQMVVKEGKEISPNACQSTTDPDATYISKGKKSFHEYSTNLSETANPDNPIQMITSVDVQPNTHSDRMFFEETLPQLKEEQAMDTLIVDAGYGGQDSADTANESNVTLIETAIKGTPPKKSAEDFVVNKEGIEKCPKGHTPLQSEIRKDQLHALFAHSDCEGCDYSACPVKKVAKGRKVTFSMDKYQKDLRRAALKEKVYKALARLRSAIEGKISSLKRCGLDRLQVVGLFRVRMVVTYSAIVSNLKQLFRYKTGKIRKKPAKGVVCAA